MDKESQSLTYEQFVKEYTDAFNNMLRYKVNEVGSSWYSEKMAKLSDENPDHSERFDREVEEAHYGKPEVSSSWYGKLKTSNGGL